MHGHFKAWRKLEEHTGRSVRIFTSSIDRHSWKCIVKNMVSNMINTSIRSITSERFLTCKDDCWRISLARYVILNNVSCVWWKVCHVLVNSTQSCYWMEFMSSWTYSGLYWQQQNKLLRLLLKSKQRSIFILNWRLIWWFGLQWNFRVQLRPEHIIEDPNRVSGLF